MANQLILPRRGFLVGLGSLLLAPAIVKAENLMPVASIDRFYWRGLVDYNIMSDTLMLRIDRANFTMPIPKHVAGIIPYDEIKKIINGITPSIREQLEPKGPEKQQRNLSLCLSDFKHLNSKIKWNDPGIGSDWDIPE